MKEFLKKLPLIGRLLRIGSCVIKAPQRFDLLFEHTESHKERLERLESEMPKTDELIRQIDELRNTLDAQMRIANSFRSTIRVHSRLLEKSASEEFILRNLCNQLGIRMDSMEEVVLHEQGKRLETLEKWQAEADNRFENTEKCLESTNEKMSRYGIQLSDVANIGEGYLNKLVDCVCHNAEAMKAINLSLSGYPTIWGDPNRLHISDSAAVYTCLFNTNSGSITVGDYSFAGSNVSILAGSHDIHLQGFLRRDAQINEGCDIRIGNGVWLASGCTLLGPCTIGDNAVIACGAVVVPGTVVPDNAVYGGIPARQISTLDFTMEQDVNNPHVQKAFERNGGLLFMQGWSEKQWFPGIPCGGHWLKNDGATLLVDRKKWTLHYGLRDIDNSIIIFGSKDFNKEYPIHGEVGETSIELPVIDGQIQEVTVRLGTDTGKLFLMLVATDEEKR